MRLKDRGSDHHRLGPGYWGCFCYRLCKGRSRKIVIADISEGKDATKAVEKAGSQAIYVKTDVSKQDECDALAKAAVDRFGKIDILVNNAAIFGTIILKPFMQVSTEEWNRVMTVNTVGPFHCTKAVFPDEG